MLIYCGNNGILEELPADNILDNLRSLISDLNDKNCDVKIKVYQVVLPAMLQ